MITQKDLIKQNEASYSSTQKLTMTALFIALNIVLNQLTIPIGTTIEIGFAFLPIAIMAYLFGPIRAGGAAIFADVLGFFLRPNGFFFPGFTLNMGIAGAIYGIFLHNKPVTLRRVAMTVLVVDIVVSLILTPIWLNIMYQTNLFAILRIVKTLILYPINVGLLYSNLKFVHQFFGKKNR